MNSKSGRLNYPCTPRKKVLYSQSFDVRQLSFPNVEEKQRPLQTALLRFLFIIVFVTMIFYSKPPALPDSPHKFSEMCL